MTEANLNEVPQSGQDFRNTVIESQKRWKSLKKSPMKELSQSVDIPEAVSKNLVNLVVDNLPSYVSENFKQELKNNHPNPIIAASVLVDNRMLIDKTSVHISTPEWLNDDDVEAWVNGLTVLNEIATDTLAHDVISNLGRKNKWFLPVAGVLNFDSKTVTAYTKGLTKAEKIFGGKKKFESFRQNLILTMLTGDNGVINKQLGDLGYQDIDRFALELGREAKYTDDLEWLPKKFDKFFKRNKKDEEQKEPEMSGDTEVTALGENKHFDNSGGKFNSERLMYLTTKGMVIVDFPGVISLTLAHSIPSILSLTSSLAAAKMATISDTPTLGGIALSLTVISGLFAISPMVSMPHTLVHETCHYLSQNADHLGLEKWKK
jgi:hypothetical protein